MSIMKGDHRQKSEKNEKQVPVEDVKTEPDDVIEIDPAEFWGSEEFGFRRRGSNASRQ